MNLTPRIVEKVWGHEEVFRNKEYCIKKLVLKKNRFCSVHKHNEKTETFLIIKGTMMLHYGRNKNVMKQQILTKDDVFHMPKKTWHRFVGMRNTEFYECSTFDKPEDSIRAKNMPSGKIRGKTK